MDPDVVPAKAALRRRMRALRAGLVGERAAASQRAADLAPVGRWPAAPIVAGYRAMETEIDPAPLLARLAAAGARIVLPVVIARGEPLVFRQAGAAATMTPDAAGILAPPPSAPALAPGLILAPLLAFDRAGGRLGQGGGYYDRTVRALRARGPVLVVGLAFAGQVVDHVPMGPRDERLDAILTEIGYMEPPKG